MYVLLVRVFIPVHYLNCVLSLSLVFVVIYLLYLKFESYSCSSLLFYFCPHNDSCFYSRFYDKIWILSNRTLLLIRLNYTVACASGIRVHEGYRPSANSTGTWRRRQVFICSLFLFYFTLYTSALSNWYAYVCLCERLLKLLEGKNGRRGKEMWMAQWLFQLTQLYDFDQNGHFVNKTCFKTVKWALPSPLVSSSPLLSSMLWLAS